MATPLICLKISPENVKQLSVKTSSVKRSSVSVEGSLTVRWSKKYLSAKSPSLFGIQCSYAHYKLHRSINDCTRKAVSQKNMFLVV